MLNVGDHVIVDNQNRRRWNGKTGRVDRVLSDKETYEVKLDDGGYALFEECELLVRRPPGQRQDSVSRLCMLESYLELAIKSPLLAADEREALIVGQQGTRAAMKRLINGEDDTSQEITGEIVQVLEAAPEDAKDFNWDEEKDAPAKRKRA